MAETAEFGVKKDIADDPIIVAQRYLNIYRQLHIFTPEKKDAFHKELQALSTDVKRSLTSIPGGILLQEYMDETFGSNVVDEFKGEKVSIKDLHHSDDATHVQHVAVPAVSSNVVIDESFATTIANAIKDSQLELAKMFAEHKQEVVIQQAAGAEGFAPIAPTVVIDDAFGNNVAAAILASQSELLKALKENKPEIIVQQPANQEGFSPAPPTVVIDDAFGDSIAAAIMESQSELIKAFASIKPEVVVQQTAAENASQASFDGAIGATIANAIKDSQKELISAITAVSKENTEMLKQLLEKSQSPIIVQENNKKDKNKNNQNQNNQANNGKNKEPQNKNEQKDFAKNKETQNKNEQKNFDKPKENNNQHPKKEKIIIEQKKSKPKFEKPKKPLINWSEMMDEKPDTKNVKFDEEFDINSLDTINLDEELSKTIEDQAILTPEITSDVVATPEPAVSVVEPEVVAGIAPQITEDDYEWEYLEGNDAVAASDDDYEWEYVEDDGSLVEGEDYEWEYVDEIPQDAK